MRPGVLAAVSALVLAVLVGATSYLWWSRPIADETVVSEVGALASEAFVAARHDSCPRSPWASALRGREPRDGEGREALRRLAGGLAPAGLAACLAAVGARNDALADAVSGGVAPTAPPGAWETIVPARPVETEASAVETELLAACGGASEALASALAYRSVCTPAPIGEDAPSLVGYLRLARAVAVEARASARAGRFTEAATRLLDVLQLGGALMAGRPSLIGVMTGVAIRRTGIAHLLGLVASDATWSDEELDLLLRETRALAVDDPGAAARVLADDQLTLVREALERRGWRVPPEIAGEIGAAMPMGPSEPDDDGALLLLVHRAQPRIRAWCAGATTSEDCVLAVRAAIDIATLAAPDGRSFPPSFARVDRERYLAAAYRDAITLYQPYVARAMGVEATLRALPAVFVHRQLVREGACADARCLETALDALSPTHGFGGHFTVRTEADGHTLDVCAPGWLAPGGTTACLVALTLPRSRDGHDEPTDLVGRDLDGAADALPRAAGPELDGVAAGGQ